MSCELELLRYFSLLAPGSINTDVSEFCVGGPTTIGGYSDRRGPATGGSGDIHITGK